MFVSFSLSVEKLKQPQFTEPAPDDDLRIAGMCFPAVTPSHTAHTHTQRLAPPICAHTRRVLDANPARLGEEVCGEVVFSVTGKLVLKENAENK